MNDYKSILNGTLDVEESNEPSSTTTLHMNTVSYQNPFKN